MAQRIPGKPSSRPPQIADPDLRTFVDSARMSFMKECVDNMPNACGEKGYDNDQQKEKARNQCRGWFNSWSYQNSLREVFGNIYQPTSKVLKSVGGRTGDFGSSVIRAEMKIRHKNYFNDLCSEIFDEEIVAEKESEPEPEPQPQPQAESFEFSVPKSTPTGFWQTLGWGLAITGTALLNVASRAASAATGAALLFFQPPEEYPMA